MTRILPAPPLMLVEGGGSVRVQRIQDEFSRYASELQRLRALVRRARATGAEHHRRRHPEAA